MERKEQLIKDIQNLLNSYDGIRPTSINSDLLQFMDEKTLIDTIDALLTQKEKNSVSDTEWLEQFKTNS
ncbi:hypothetical protein [Sulfurimonas sp. NW9]|uniref:hypothetical protein n=1 Tax=Sulfurimonas sp. NW9 TaxID=2922728 RepID=UPI003DAA3518